MQLSAHLSLTEVTKSQTASRLGIDNNPTPEHLANLKLLAENIFEPIREHFGKPISVSSGYRSAILNKNTPGSAKNSQHSVGEALDLDQDSSGTGITNKQVFDFIKDNLNFDQLIFEHGTDSNPDWVHVSYSSTEEQRKSILRCKSINGKPSYQNYN